MTPFRIERAAAVVAVAAAVACLVACRGGDSPSTVTSTGGAGGTAGAAGSSTAGTAGASGGGGGTAGAAGTAAALAGAGGAASGTGGTAGGEGGTSNGATGGAAARCGNEAGSGGTAGSDVPTGCDLEVARQALVALGIGTTGATATTSTVTLPAMLTDAQWSVKNEVCNEGGYDLSPLADSTVCLVSQETTRLCQANPARVYVMMAEGAVACVYMALCPGSRIAPGVYSTVDPLCQ